MKNSQEQAIELFRSGFNCAQSVLLAMAPKYNIDKVTAVKIACGFGAGMGRLQETCGAVTGAFMVLGIHNCEKFSDNKERKDNTYKMIREFDTKFKRINKTLKCKDLLNLDLKTDEGQQEFKNKNLSERVCEKCISDAISITSELILL